jgi:hypothetical protein
MMNLIVGFLLSNGQLHVPSYFRIVTNIRSTEQKLCLVYDPKIIRQTLVFLRKQGKLDESPLDSTGLTDRHVIIDVILKCTDISNLSRPWEMINK